MKFTNEQIDEFIELYKKSSGITLSRKNAMERATKLLLMVKALIREV